MSQPWGAPLDVDLARFPQTPSIPGMGMRLLFFHSLLISSFGLWEGGEPRTSITGCCMVLSLLFCSAAKSGN